MDFMSLYFIRRTVFPEWVTVLASERSKQDTIRTGVYKFNIYDTYVCVCVCVDIREI